MNVMHKLLSFTLALTLCGCAAPDSTGQPPPPVADSADAKAPAVRPWTTAFLPEAHLVADVIEIEGPDDLLNHIALRQGADVQLETKTVTEGLRQTLTPATGSGGIELRAQLDNLTLVAFRKLVVLRRPGDLPVRVEAKGNVWWARADGSEERREDKLEILGEHGK